MNLANLPTRRASMPLWRILTCILLAGLFLYNPFLGATCATGNLMVGHPASHRATVGSSELEQFRQSDISARALLPAVTDAEILILQVATSDSAPARDIEEKVVVPLAGFSSSLRFRPPPTV